MNIKEVVDILNSKQMKITELAGSLGVSKDLLADVLKENGYVYSNKSKMREFVGEGKEKDINIVELLEGRKQGKSVKKVRINSEKSQKVVRNLKENNDNKTLDLDLELTKEEILFIKQLHKKHSSVDSDFELNQQYSKLPARKPEKKTNYIVSLNTYQKFESFAETIGEPRRMSRNDLVEMALISFMERYK